MLMYTELMHQYTPVDALAQEVEAGGSWFYERFLTKHCS